MVKINSKDERAKELKSIFKFFVLIEIIIGIIIIFNGLVRSNFGYDSVDQLAQQNRDTARQARREVPQQPRAVAPNNLDSLKQTWLRPQIPQSAQDFLETLEKEIFKESNREREKVNLAVLDWEKGLADTASYHSSDMGNKNFFSHINMDNVGPFYRIAKLHRRYIGTGGENILMISKDSTDPEILAQKIVRVWMNSTGHRQNILNNKYTSTGVGCFETHDQNNVTTIYVTTVFGTEAAYLQDDLPEVLSKNKIVPLGIECVNQEFLAPVSGEIVSLKDRTIEAFSLQGTNQAASTGNIKAPAKPGVYQLVFHFPFQKDANTAAVIPGPIFSVN